jgi:hypothetical protein
MIEVMRDFLFYAKTYSNSQVVVTLLLVMKRIAVRSPDADLTVKSFAKTMIQI